MDTEDNQGEDAPASREEATWMTLGFATLFFGVGAVQQYIAVWFQDRGNTQTGKLILLLVYLFYFFGSFQSHRCIQKLGTRLSMMLTSIAYGLLVLSIFSGSEFLSCFFAIVGGLAASVLWTGQNVVLSRISDERMRAAAVSFFWSRYPLGTGLGTLVLGVLVAKFSYDGPVLCFGLIAFASTAVFWRMPTDGNAGRQTSIGWQGPSFHLATIGCAMTVFFVRFVYALIISQVPIDLRNTLGAGYVGLVTSSFFVLPIAVSKVVAAFAISRGMFATAFAGYFVALLGVVLMLIPLGGATLVVSVVLIALASAILNPVSNLFPRWLADITSCDISRVASSFTLAGSSGMLFGLATVLVVSRTEAYAISLGVLALSSLTLSLVFSQHTKQVR